MLYSGSETHAPSIYKRLYSYCNLYGYNVLLYQDMKPILRQLIVSHALSQDWENSRDTILQADESDDIEH